MMQCNYLASLNLPGRNFFPISMVNFSGEDHQKSVILVTNAEEAFSLDGHDVGAAVSGNDGPFLFTKCNLETNRQICGLKNAGLNVVAVTTEGQLMAYDASANKFSSIDSYYQIKHVDQGPEENQLFIVRQNRAGKSMLEVVEAGISFSNSKTVKSYEITAECIDSGSKFCIKSITVNAASQRFLGDFLGFTTLSAGDEIILMAIYNNLFWLQQRAEDDCDSIFVRCFASNVLGFDFSESCTCLTVLLEAGVLVVFNQSLDPETLLISTSYVYLQAPVEAYILDNSNNSFLYSNGLTTHRIWYHFSEETKQLVTEVEDISVCGVVAMTLLETKPIALLLTENNQFYTLDCTEKHQKAKTDSSRMVQLRKEMRATTKRVSKILTDEVEFDKRLEQALQTEQAHFNVLALHRNMKVFSKLSYIATSFQQEMPLRKSNTLFIEKRGKEMPCLFATVNIAINLGFFELLLTQKRWCVCLEYAEETVMYPIHETFDKTGVFRAIVFLAQSQLALGLPDFRASLYASVRNGTENLLLTIPAPSSRSTEDDISNLIRKTDTMPTPNTNYTKQVAYDIVEQHNPNPSKSIERRSLSYCIRNEQSKTKAVSFSSQLENQSSDTWCVLDEPVSIAWHDGKDTLHLKTDLAAALHLTKRFLLQDDEYSAEIEQRLDKLKGICLELQAVSTPALIEQLYRRTRSNDLFVDETSLFSK